MRLPGFIRRNWKLKVGCFLIAFVTWVGVVYAGNPPETKVVSLRVPQSRADIPSAYVLVHAVNPVQVRVGGNANTLDALSPDVLSMTVDWAAVNRGGTYAIPISIRSSDPNIEVITPPTSIQVDLDTLASKLVPITIVITSPPPRGYASGNELPTPSTVAVTGPSHELSDIEARVSVPLSTQKANFQQQLPVLVYDKKSGIQLTNVSVDHSLISVSITITADVTTKVMPVLVKLVGNPSPGRYLTGIVVSPLSVVATGSLDLLNTVDSVSTMPVQLNGVFGTYTVSVTLVAPAGVTLSQSKVTVTIDMASVPAPPTPTPTPSPTPSPGP